MPEVNMGLNVYEYNKNIMKQMPTLEDLTYVKEVLYKFVENTNASRYVMLLCKEKADYTLFDFDSAWHNEQFVEDVLECFFNRGLGIVDISFPNEDNYNAIEIWVKKPGQMEEADLYYIFAADSMVITY